MIEALLVLVLIVVYFGSSGLLSYAHARGWIDGVTALGFGEWFYWPANAVLLAPLVARIPLYDIWVRYNRACFSAAERRVGKVPDDWGPTRQPASDPPVGPPAQ